MTESVAKAWRIFLLVLWVAVVAFGAFRFSVNNDIRVFLPADRPTDSIAQSLISQNPQSRILLLAIEGQDTDALIATSKKLTPALRKLSGISAAMNGGGGMNAALVDGLFRYRYQLTPLQDMRFSEHEMQAYLSRAYGLLSTSQGWIYSEYLPRDPSGAFEALFDSWRDKAAASMPNSGGVWLRPETHRAYILVYMQSGVFDADAYRAKLESIQRVFEAARTDPSLHLRLSSPYTIALQTNDRISHEAKLLSVAATVLLLAWLFIVFRSLRTIGLLLLPVLGASAFAAAGVVALYGSIHGITLAFGITLLGLTVDYPIHLLSHHDRESGSVLRILFMGILTTCIGFGAMVFSSLPGLQQLGAFVVLGLLAAWGWVYGMQGMLSHAPMRLALPLAVTRMQARKLAASVLCGGAVLVFLCSVALVAGQRKVWNDDAAALMPASPEILKQDADLRAELHVADSRYVLAITGKDREAVLQRSESLRSLLEDWKARKLIASYDMAALYQPSQATQQARLDALPPVNELQKRINNAVAHSGFAAEPFAHAAAVMHQDAAQGYFSARSLDGGLLAARIQTLLPEIHGKPVGLVTLSGIHDAETLQKQITLMNDRAVYFVDLKSSIGAMMHDFRAEAVRLALTGGALLLLALVVALRNVRKTLQVVLPVFTALSVVSAVLLLCGQALTLFHIMALLLVAGVGVDYALFRYVSPADAERQTQVTRAIIGCGVTTMIVFAVLACSTVPALKDMGLTVLLGTGYILLWCLLVPRLEDDAGGRGA